MRLSFPMNATGDEIEDILSRAIKIIFRPQQPE
jgi:hypothetical protein